MRRYDLTNVRDDLDLCSDVGRAFVIWGSVFIGIGFTLAVTFFSTLAASKHPAWLLELAGYGAILFIALGIGSFWADHKFSKKATITIDHVKSRVDSRNFNVRQRESERDYSVTSRCRYPLVAKAPTLGLAFKDDFDHTLSLGRGGGHTEGCVKLSKEAGIPTYVISRA